MSSIYSNRNTVFVYVLKELTYFKNTNQCNLKIQDYLLENVHYKKMS